MSKDVAEVPVLDPLVEGGILDMPARTNDLECSLAAQPAGMFADNAEAPSRGRFFGFSDHGADHTDFSFVGVERVDVVGVPEVDVLFLIGIVVISAWWLVLP